MFSLHSLAELIGNAVGAPGGLASYFREGQGRKLTLGLIQTRVLDLHSYDLTGLDTADRVFNTMDSAIGRFRGLFKLDWWT
jgi:hypothetical protein